MSPNEERIKTVGDPVLTRARLVEISQLRLAAISLSLVTSWIYPDGALKWAGGKEPQDGAGQLQYIR